MIIWTFFRLQMIFLDTKNSICPMPSAPEVFPISICTVFYLEESGENPAAEDEEGDASEESQETEKRHPG